MVGRKGHKSTKIPGVKLRPALNNTRSRSDVQSSGSFTEGEGTEENTQFVDFCPRPFKCLVICATGVPEKTALFKKALELGALYSPDFTDRVTHLIATTPQGAKYRCAVERKIPIMKPEWIVESYGIWLRGDDVDLHESIRIYRMPIFSQVMLTLSGIEDLKHTTHIEKLVQKEGGSYVKDLTRLTKVTHLLCAGDEITDKMRYAEKFNGKEGADIKIVWEEWFWDCLEFGGQFEEEPYKVTHPRPEKRRSSPEPLSPPPSSDPVSMPDGPILNKVAPRANPHSEDEDEEEVAQVKRVQSDTLQIWQSLLKTRGFEIVEGKLLRSPSKSQTRANTPSMQDDVVPFENVRSGNVVRHILDGNPGKSMLSKFRRTESFAPHQPEAGPSGVNTVNRPFRRVVSTAAPRAASSFLQGQATPLPRVVPALNQQSNNIYPVTQTSASAVPNRAMFTGLKFRLLGEARVPNVRSAIEDYGGQVLGAEEEDEVDYVVVRLISGNKFYKDEPDVIEKTKYRTECWLERCIYEERVCSAHERVVFTPLKVETPIPAAEQINLSFSGLEESEACWVRRLVRALGISLAPNFSRRSTHLLCPSGTGAKYEKAHEWGIPVVSLDWLEDVARLGIIAGVADRAVSGSIQRDLEPQKHDETENEGNAIAHDVKGKGKAKEVDHDQDVRMVDITNSASSDSQSANRDRLIRAAEHEHRPAPANEDIGDVFGDPSILRASPPNLKPEIQDPPPQAEPAVEMLSSIDPMEPSSSLRYGEHDDDGSAHEQTVPSSNTPSPLKNPRSSSMPVSPTRPAPSTEATRLLQEKLTTLLGKRRSEEEEVLAPKHGKRHRRPSPSKRQSRQNSRQNSGELPFPRAVSPIPFEPAFNGLVIRPFDEMNLTQDNDHPSEDSVRVTYEDPAQRAEQIRLMSLLGGADNQATDLDDSRDGNKSRRKNPPRRSSRVAGF